MAKKKRKRTALKIILGVFLFFVFCFLFLFIYYAKDLPRPEVFTERPFILPTKIYDREGKVLLYQIYGEEKRTVVPLSQVPDNLVKAVIAAEDANFYHHFGLDFKGILRAILRNVKIGEPIYGGSTISQQLIRSSFLTLEKTAQRKTKEIILTLELERRYSKEQILEFYLNQVPFGSNAYGVEAASQTYFQKTVSDLSLAQAALLASLVKGPSYLSPYGSHRAELFARKDYILERMEKDGYITSEEMETAKKEPLEFAGIRQAIKAPHFVLYIKEYLESKYPDYFLQEKGLKVYTTLDWELQEAAEIIVQEGVKNNQSYHAYNASLVALNPQNGEILAMIGSADWYATSSYPFGCETSQDGCLFDPKFNVATLGERQPGSSFKPFAYAESFRDGLTSQTVLWDAKTEFNPNCTSTAVQEKDEYGLGCYHPKNYDDRFRGQVTLREALAQSINVPSVKVLYLAGLQDTINLAQNLGITTLDQPQSFYGLSLVLGGGEVKLLDMVSAYGVFATRGLSIPPVSILKIEDSQGNIIEENKKTQKRVLEAQVCDLVNDILSDNEARTPIFGPRSLLYLPGYQVAAKTGTTQDFHDGWTIGYTSSVVAGVWVGNNNNSPMLKEPGVVLAGPIWHKFIKKALEKYPSAESFPKIETATTTEAAYEENMDKNSPQYQNWQAGIENWLKFR